MKSLTIFLTFAVLISCVAAEEPQKADNTLSAKEKSCGWELLFNGKDISKWRNFKKETIK
ncbi:MAG: DUF1080 domain-containing protein, partial [Lentisphaeraceae bacterium]|nr:DUF1080 domain-containing protein [Lentisphaeraceae bacterium]